MGFSGWLSFLKLDEIETNDAMKRRRFAGNNQMSFPVFYQWVQCHGHVVTLSANT